MINKKVNFELKKMIFYENIPNKKLSADLKSAINFELDYEPQYI